MKKMLAHWVVVAALLISGCATTTIFPNHQDSELLAMSTEQRVEYLAQANQFANQNQKQNPLLPNRLFDLAIVPTYQAMMQKDGVYFAAEFYALTLAQAPQWQNDYSWTQAVRRGALADPVFMQLYSKYSFPPFQMRPFQVGRDRYNLGGLDDQLSKALYSLAERGEPRACEWVSDNPNPSEAVVSACASVPNQAQANYARWKGFAQRQQEAEDEATRRYEADRASEIARAQEVLHQCAAVGVPNPVIDQSKLHDLAGRWREAGPGRGKLNGRDDANSTEWYIRDMENALAVRTEGQKIKQGSAVTPVLTPRMFMILVKPQCGIQG